MNWIPVCYDRGIYKTPQYIYEPSLPYQEKEGVEKKEYLVFYELETLISEYKFLWYDTYRLKSM